MRPDRQARPEYVEAFRELVARIARALESAPAASLPVRMYVAGGAALHFYTGARVTKDVDAVFSRRIVLPDDLKVSYRDPDGAARLLYFDRQYNDTFGLLHEDAYEQSQALTLEGIDAQVLDVRLLSPLDLAVSKISRFSEQDREDIAALASLGLISSDTLRHRAEQALLNYVGDTTRVRGAIESACRIVADAEARRPKGQPHGRPKGRR
ncbi:MAG: hypothetical protein IPI06_04190 [Gammaproteobacteria bacterium]|nr:hypothetical protein [Gammaproteobacteria bacterium]